MFDSEDRNTVSEGWRHTVDLSSTTIPNESLAIDDEEHFCKLILYKEIKDSRVRIWDILILVPNLLFLLFMVVRFNRARLKLRATSSPIFLAFYGLVICNVVISVIRCVVSMTVNAAASVGGKADKVLWVTVRFFLLSTEMSVVIFGLAFGHLDSHSSIRRVLLATSFIALAFTITQGTLELVLPDDTFHIPSRDFYVFGHGGMMFWFCSSLVFTTIYLFILILPWTRMRDRLLLPTKKSFYVYAGTLATLDLVQSIGAGFLNYTQNPIGLCIVDLTAAVYLTLFTPLVYHTFLSEFFGISQPSIMFSYKAQVDDAMEEDTVSLPHQQSFSSLKTDSDYIYQVHTPSIHMPLYDSQASKSSTSKHRTSLYSLTSVKDLKRSSGNVSGSQITLHKSTSSAKGLMRRISTEDNISDFTNYPLTKSDTFAGVSKSTTTDSKLSEAAWTIGDDPASVSESKPLSSDSWVDPPPRKSSVVPSDTDLVFLGRKSNVGNAIRTFGTLNKRSAGILPPESKTSSRNIAFGPVLQNLESSKFSEIPTLGSTLHSILDRGTGSSVQGKSLSERPTDYDAARKASRYVDETKGVGSRKRIEEEYREGSSNASSVASSIGGSSVVSSDASKDVTQSLLSKPASSGTRDSPKKRKVVVDSTSTESAGLNDYLLSMRSAKPRKAAAVRSRISVPRLDSSQDPNFSHYTQTESL